MKTIQLSFPHAPNEANRDRILYGVDSNISQAERVERFDKARRYRIERVTDSIEFHPGDYLERAQAQALADDPEWKLTVTVIKEGK